MKKAKAVFIASDPPMPPTGGGTRTFHCLRALASLTNCRLYVLFPVRSQALPSVICETCQSIATAKVAFPSDSDGRVIAWLRNLQLLFAPWSVSRRKLVSKAAYHASNPYEGNHYLKKTFFIILRYSVTSYALLLYRLGYAIPARSLERFDQYESMKHEISEAISESEIVWLDFSTLFPFFLSLRTNNPGLKIICNAHNIEYRALDRMKGLAKDKLEKKWFASQAAAMRKLELKGFQDCDLVITCSEEDRNEILQNLPALRVEVIPNGVDIDYFTPHSKPTVHPTLLFTGTMGYEPNRDAVEHFLENIFPLVLKLNPKSTFCIAGANADLAFKKYQQHGQVEIISSPADIRPVYDKAWIVVVPLRSGSGTRLKILEAMAMDKPVISTSVGAEGIMVGDGNQLLIANEAQDFANKIDLLIRDRKLSAELAKKGRDTIINLYNWDNIRTRASEAVRLYAGA